MKDLKKTLFLSLGLGVKLLVGLIAVKLCARQLGPEGFGITGQLSSMLSVIALLAGAGVSTGLAKIYAGNEFSADSRSAWIGAAKLISIFTALVMILVIAFISPWAVSHLLQDSSHPWWLIGGLAFSALPIAYAGIGQGKINGSHREDFYAFSLVVGSILGLCGLWLLSRYAGATGALLGMIWLPVAQAMMMSLFGRKIDKLPARFHTKSDLTLKINFLLSYGALSVSTGILMPVVYIAIRMIIQEYCGNELFGYWQATLRISEAYCQLPLLLLTVVLFSRYAATAAMPLDFSTTAKTYIFMTLVMIGLAVFVYLSRAVWIELVFTPRFRPMEKFVPWQLTGDTLRIISYIGTTALAARGNIKLCILAEIMQGCMLFLLSMLLIPRYVQYGMYYAYVTSYAIYLVLTIYFISKFNKPISIGGHRA